MDFPQELLVEAASVRERAFAPYSRFSVGAAILDDRGRIHAGCNVENVSYGLTICAERVAVFKGIADGAKSFQALVVVATNAAPPCGACRQVLAQFARQLPVWLVDAHDSSYVIATNLDELLPMRFTLD